MDRIQTIKETLIALEAQKLIDTVRGALADGIAANEILNKGLIGAMDVIGEKMENGDMFIPEVLKAAQLMESAIEVLKPQMGEGDYSAKGVIVIGTVKGDMHDIGKNLVSLMIKSSGMEVIDLGVDISPETFVSAIEENRPQILCLSALLTTTLPMIQETIEAVSQNGLRDRLKILVGGAPVTQDYADEVKADGYASDAGGAAKLVKRILV